MIFDGYWKWELKKISWQITIWRKLHIFGGYTKHMLTKAVLYSAVVLRKVIEDEKEVEKETKRSSGLTPSLEILNSTVSAVKYPFSGEADWVIRGKLIASNYGNGETASLKTKDVCNLLVHSYVWSVVGYSGNKEYAGFLVASDFNKAESLHFISFDEWTNILNLVIEKGTF